MRESALTLHQEREMTEQIAHVNDIDICYETFGDATDRPLLLVQGAIGQMICWDTSLLEQLVERGCYVIRFDNRDSGRSSQLTQTASPIKVLLRLQRPAYILRDCAADAVGLLDHLDIPAAHVLGPSMGGMITQTIAIEYPSRVLSLTSITSTTGNLRVGYPTKPAAVRLIRKAPNDRAAYIAHLVKMQRDASSPGFPFDENAVHDRITRSADRGMSPEGALRQAAAALGSPDRTDELRRLNVPTFVVRGLADPYISSGGRATAKAIPGAELLLIPGMGHELPPQIWPDLVDGVVRTAERRDSYQ
jgi:pimeloyl-ACP methyl ester carboxylesterase